MKEELKKDFFTSLALFQTIIKGWYFIYKNIALDIIAWWLRKNRSEQFFSGLLILQFILSLSGWIGYTIDFGEGPEKISTSVNPNLYFILISLANLVIMEFFSNGAFFLLYLVLQIVAMVLAIAGYIYPRPVFVNFISETDFHFRYTFYLFFITLVVNTVSAFRKFRN